MHALDPYHQRGYLGANVAERLVRHANRVGNDREQLLVFHPALEELHHGEPQAFEIDFADAAGYPACRHAAKIGMVRDVSEKADEFTVVKRRGNGIEIHDVLAAAVWIVGDDHVAGGKLLRENVPTSSRMVISKPRAGSGYDAPARRFGPRHR